MFHVKQRRGDAGEEPRETLGKMPEEKLQRYAELIERYHDTLDLVSFRALSEVRTLIDEARQYAEVIAEAAGPDVTVVDLGSGVGLPGIVLAVMMPAATVHLVERRRRRAAFLSMAAGQLSLDNARVWSGDVRDLEGVCAHVVTAQAVTTFAGIARLTRHLHRDPCFLVSRRGPDWLGELDELRGVLAGGPDVSGGAAAAQGGAVIGPDLAPHGELSPGRPVPAQDAPALTVVAERRLGRDGSLVALRLRGGPACPSSG